MPPPAGRRTISALLRPHIRLLQISDPNREKQSEKHRAAQIKGGHLPREQVLRTVGVHTHQHERVGVKQPVIGVHHRQPAHAGEERDGDGDGEGADEGGQKQLQGGDGKSAQAAAQKPGKDLDRRKAGHAHGQAACHIQNAHIKLGQKRHRGHGEKLSGIQHGYGNGRGHQSIPVMVEIFQPPQVGAVEADEGREEKVGIKQRRLGPQRVPAFRQDPDILQIVKAAHQRAQDGKDQEHDPDKRALQLDQFGAHTAKQHRYHIGQTSFFKKSRFPAK